MRKTPLTSWQAFAEAVYHLCRDPWGSLSTPAVPANRCPDLCNIGVAIQKKTDRAFRQYAGKFIQGGTDKESECRAIADLVINAINEYNESEFGLHGVLAEMYPGLKTREINGVTYAFDEAANQIQLDPRFAMIQIEVEKRPVKRLNL